MIPIPDSVVRVVLNRIECRDCLVNFNYKVNKEVYTTEYYGKTCCGRHPTCYVFDWGIMWRDPFVECKVDETKKDIMQSLYHDMTLEDEPEASREY